MITLCKCGCGKIVSNKYNYKNDKLVEYITGHNNRKLPIVNEIRYCKCGCGKIISNKHNYKNNKLVEYITGHNNRKLPIVNEIRYCKCGCGKIVSNKYNKDKLIEYIIGHSQKGKTPWNKGIKRPEFSGKNHPQYGKKHNKLSIEKMKKYWSIPEHKKKASLSHSGEKHYNYGKPLSKDIKIKISKSTIGKIPSDEARKNMRLSAINRIEKERCNGNRLVPSRGKNETEILNKIEKDINIPIDRDFKIYGYFPDGYCHKTNIIYEIDEKHHLTTRQKKKDVKKDEYLKSKLNCQIIRIPD